MKKEIDKTIGSRIRERRTALKMTQTQLAEMKNTVFYHSLLLKNRIKWAFSHNGFH